MTETTDRTLVLLRHAKAEEAGASDHERELSARGHADADAVGRWLVEAGHSFAAVVSSTSTRTRQTLADVQAAGVSVEEIRFEDRVYEASPAVLLDVLADLPDQLDRVLLIGHAPTIPELADLLADPKSSDRDALDELRSSFPSGCLAVLSFGQPWSALSSGRAKLSVVTAPGA